MDKDRRTCPLLDCAYCVGQFWCEHKIIIVVNSDVHENVVKVGIWNLTTTTISELKTHSVRTEYICCKVEALDF